MRVFGYPKEEASVIAIKTVYQWIKMNPDYHADIIFCVYSDEDYNLYKKLNNSQNNIIV